MSWTLTRYASMIMVGVAVIDDATSNNPDFFHRLLVESVAVERRVMHTLDFPLELEETYASLSAMAAIVRNAQQLFNKQQAALRKLTILLSQEYDTSAEEIGVQALAFFWKQVGRDFAKRFKAWHDYETTLQELQTGGILQDHITARFPIMLDTIHKAMHELEELRLRRTWLRRAGRDLVVDEQIVILRRAHERLESVMVHSDALRHASRM